MNLEELKIDVASGAVDTVLLAITDMQGRLVGKRASARLFLEELAEHGARLANRPGLSWIEPLSARPGGVRLACVAAAAIGDPSMVPWLLEVAKQPEHARIAAWAIRAITGVAIAGALAGKEPEGFSAGPSEDPKDERVALDPDAMTAMNGFLSRRLRQRGHRQPGKPRRPPREGAGRFPVGPVPFDRKPRPALHAASRA